MKIAHMPVKRKYKSLREQRIEKLTDLILREGEFENSLTSFCPKIEQKEKK